MQPVISVVSGQNHKTLHVIQYSLPIYYNAHSNFLGRVLQMVLLSSRGGWKLVISDTREIV